MGQGIGTTVVGLTSTFAPKATGGIQRLVSALNGAGSATVAVLGPSTSTGTGTWASGGIGRMVAGRTALGQTTYLWSDATSSPWSDTASGAYDAGAATYTATTPKVYGRKLIDTFDRAAAEVKASTSTPVHAAKVWSSGGSGTGQWATDGTGGMVAVAAASTLIYLDAGVTSTRMRAQCTVAMDQTTASKEFALTLGGTSYRVNFYVRNITGTWSAMIWKNGATSASVVGYTTITGAAGKSSVPMVATIEGTTVTLTVDGQTISGSLLTADTDLIAGATKMGMISAGAITTGTGTRITNMSMDLIEDGPTGTITLYNASKSGTTLAYHEARMARMLPVEPDVIVVDSCSHNHLTEGATAFTAVVESALDEALRLWPNAAVILSSENPETPPNANRTYHAARNLATQALAARRGWLYVPAYEAFLADGPQAARIRADGTHPTSSGSDDGTPDPDNGQHLWATTLIQQLVTAGLNAVAGDGLS